MDGLLAINLSQPDLNDMDMIYAATVDRGLKIVGSSGEYVAQAVRDLRGRVHSTG